MFERPETLDDLRYITEDVSLQQFQEPPKNLAAHSADMRVKTQRLTESDPF